MGMGLILLDQHSVPPNLPLRHEIQQTQYSGVHLERVIWWPLRLRDGLVGALLMGGSC